MISTPHRQTARLLIEEAVTAGARRAKACAELEISDRTLRRWSQDGQAHADQRPLVPRPEPRNKLSDEECASILSLCNSTEFASLPPGQIVPKLADQGRYLASESSFYRILRADGQQHHRGRAKPPVRCKPPTSYKASASCEVWTWDITWMPGPALRMFFYLYLIVDIFKGDDILTPINPFATRQLQNLHLVQGRDRLEVEAVQAFDRWELGGLDPALDHAAFPVDHLQLDEA